MNVMTVNKDELLKSISNIFIQYGMRSSSMDDIARYLKISKKTLYSCFENKNDIVEQVVAYRKRIGDTYAEKVDFSSTDIISYLFDVLQFVIDAFALSMPNNIYDIKKYYPDIYRKHFQNIDNHSLLVINKLLEQGIQNKVFREDITKELEAYLLANQILLLIDPESVVTSHFSIKEVISKILENFIRAIATQKGTEQLEQILKNRN